jgi:hypothetical protein
MVKWLHAIAVVAVGGSACAWRAARDAERNALAQPRPAAVADIAATWAAGATQCAVDIKPVQLPSGVNANNVVAVAPSWDGSSQMAWLIQSPAVPTDEQDAPRQVAILQEDNTPAARVVVAQPDGAIVADIDIPAQPTRLLTTLWWHACSATEPGGATCLVVAHAGADTVDEWSWNTNDSTGGWQGRRLDVVAQDGADGGLWRDPDGFVAPANLTPDDVAAQPAPWGDAVAWMDASAKQVKVAPRDAMADSLVLRTEEPGERITSLHWRKGPTLSWMVQRIGDANTNLQWSIEQIRCAP